MYTNLIDIVACYQLMYYITGDESARLKPDRSHGKKEMTKATHITEAKCKLESHFTRMLNPQSAKSEQEHKFPGMSVA